MTWRGAALLLLSLVGVGVSAAVPLMFWPALVIVAVIVAIVIWDGRRAPGGSALTIARTVDELLSVGAANDVRIRVSSAGVPAEVTVRDCYPPELHSDHAMVRTRLPADFHYTLTPQARGEAQFGPVVVRAEGPWRLGFRQTSVDVANKVLIDADLSAVRTYEALARRGQLAELGVRAQRRRSEGTEFERIRDAVPDDPLRHINWKATARTGRLMAIEMIPERAQPVIICLDHGRLMGVGADALTKLDHAINAALLLVHVALASGDRVGVFAFADRVTVRVPALAGKVQMRRFLDAVRPLKPSHIEADYDEGLLALSRWQKRRALLAIFTDVVDANQADALIRQCARLHRRHLPLVITVRDPAILDLAAAVPTDAESTYSRAIAAGIISDRELTLRRLRAAGAETIDADVRTLSPQVINRYLDLKRRSRI